MKFGNEILALCGRMFGITDATETEVHQALQEAKTYEELKADAIKEAGVTLEKLNEVSTKMESMTTEMEGMKTDNQAKSEKVDTLEGKVNELTQALEQKDKTIAEHVEQISALSKDLAGYRVTATATDTPNVAVPPGESIAVADNKKSTHRQVVNNEQFKEIFN